MKIAINTLLVLDHVGGAKTFLVHLIKALLDLRSEHEFFLIVSPYNEHIFHPFEDRVRLVRTPRYGGKFMRIVVEQALIPRYVREYGIDVLLNPSTTATIRPGCAQVFVAQAPLALKSLRIQHAPQEVSLSKRLYYDLLFSASVARADIVMAVSDDIRKHILLQEQGLSPDKVRVVHEGVALHIPDTEEPQRTARSRPYILFVSTLYRYKKADRLIEAFAELQQSNRLTGHDLIIVGKDHNGELERLRALAHSLGVSQKVIFAGMLAHGEVFPMYRGADVFVFPSSVETFGLPIFEAMACDTPVVASNRMSVPEVAGDAALIVDPDDIAQMADAIERLSQDDQLRTTLIERGRKRITLFPWQETARKTLALLQEAVELR